MEIIRCIDCANCIKQVVNSNTVLYSCKLNKNRFTYDIFDIDVNKQCFKRKK